MIIRVDMGIFASLILLLCCRLTPIMLGFLPDGCAALI